MHARKQPGLVGLWLCAWLCWVAWARGEEPRPIAQPPSARAEPRARPGEERDAGNVEEPLAGETATRPTPLVPVSPSILKSEVAPIDLGTALRLANVQNPDLLIARQRVVEAAALQRLAAAQFLPSLNGGTNYDTHTGVLQQSNGNILTVNRSAVYVGAGANAVAAGSVGIPGVVLVGNPAAVTYGYLASRQVVQAQQFLSEAVRNQTLLRVAVAYSELLRAEGALAVAQQVRAEASEVARLTAAYVLVGEGRQADADRAATELARRVTVVQAEEGHVLTASARLAEVLNIDPSVRLHPTDAWIVPMPVVPDPIPLQELIALALLRRPELGERRAVVREALLSLQNARVLPFSPNVIVGFSSGGFGGGSNLVRPVFGGFGGRSDFDAVAFWTIQNLGVGNLALINLARARLRSTQYEEIAVLDHVRAEVAEAYARTHARYAQIETTQQAVRTGTDAFREDFLRIKDRAQNALPIELLDSMRLLARARGEYLDAIVDYNIAQFELYVALGQPPADALAHPVPTEGVVPHDEATAPRPPGPAPNQPPTAIPRAGEAVPLPTQPGVGSAVARPGASVARR